MLIKKEKKNIFIGTFVDLSGVVDELGLGREKVDGGVSEHGIDLIHDTRHLYTRARIDGIKVCHVVFQIANKR